MATEGHTYSSLPTDDPEDQSEGHERQSSEQPVVAYDENETKAEKQARMDEIVRLQGEIARLSDLSDVANKNLDNLKGFWGGKVAAIQKTIEDLTRQITKNDEKMQDLLRVGTEYADAPPPGPKCLWWVKGGRFTAVCSLVVIGNLGTMFMEIVHPRYKQKFFVLDQVVLCFYVTEVVLKILLWRGDLLIGPCSVVWWNWLDCLIVIAGIFDQWVQPLLTGPAGSHGSKGGNSQMVQIVKMLRIARLARILKTVRAFFQSDLSWAEGNTFQVFIMGVIAANSLIMSFEADFPDFAGWFYVEQLLLCIFSFELSVRLRRWHCRFFYHETDLVWNWLDFIIVFGGIIDQWLMPFIGIVKELAGIEPTRGGGQMGQIMTMLRMARLLRILRLVRLVKNIPPLFTLIVGIMQAMQGMAWVLVLTAVFLYAAGLLCVKLVGHGLLFGGNAPPDVSSIFPSVPESMFVLFKVMNGDMEMVEPLFEALPLSKLAFVLYMVVSSWAILSILTAVVSENMIRATEHNREEFEQERAFTKDRNVREYLGKLFADADTDNSNELGEEEFEGMLNDKTICADLTEQTGLEQHDLEQIFRFLMTGDKISREPFIDALMSESRSVTERSVFRLEKRLMDLQSTVEAHIRSLNKPDIVSRNAVRATGSHVAAMLQVVQDTETEESRTPQKADQAPVVLTADQIDMVRNMQREEADVPRTPSQRFDQVNLVGNPMASPVSADVVNRENSVVNRESSRCVEDLVLPFQIALQIVEHRLDSIALQPDVQSWKGPDSSSSAQKEASCEALLTELEGSLGLSKHRVRLSLQSILTKMDSYLQSMQQGCMPEPLMRRLEIQLQKHHQSATELLMTTIEQKLDISKIWKETQPDVARSMGRYDNQQQQQQEELNRAISAVQTGSSVAKSSAAAAGTIERGVPPLTPAHADGLARTSAAGSATGAAPANYKRVPTLASNASADMAAGVK